MVGSCVLLRSHLPGRGLEAVGRTGNAPVCQRVRFCEEGRVLQGGFAECAGKDGEARGERRSFEVPSKDRSAFCALRQITPAIAIAVSAMRLEKPHSLSYQDITRTSVPLSTLVWSMWKVEEWESWLKSIETLGASV